MEMMHCVDLVERVTEYLEQALDPTDMVRFRDHLRMCTGCEAYVDEVLLSLRVMSAVPEERLSDGLETSLLEIFSSWREGDRS